MDEEVKFDEYRFHFRPLDPPSLFNPIEAIEERMSRKNDILEEILKSDLIFFHRNNTLKYLHFDLADKLHQFRIANLRKKKMEHDFQPIIVEDEPSANVFIWNNPDEQKILIESDKTSFNESQVVAKLLEKALNDRLKQHQLALSIKIQIEQSEFWTLVKKYEGRITEVEFNLLYPNLPKSHTVIAEELKEVFASISSPEGSVKFKAEEGQTLTNLNEQNKQIDSLNEASSLQGMPIVIKVRKDRTKKRTGKSRKSYTIKLPTDTPNLIEVIKSILEK